MMQTSRINFHFLMKELKRKQGKAKGKKVPLLLKKVKHFKKSRVNQLTLTHGKVLTPVYMPVGTKAAIKSLVAEQLHALGCQIMLCNTYHMALSPGGQFLQKFGGVHKFMNWQNNVLTDSGGFQMVSLSKLSTVTQEGVSFNSPYDGSVMFISPQKSIQIQNQIGSDIMMALDDVIKTTTQGERMGEAMERTIRWISRNLKANKNPQTQALFPIVQGGLDLQLRKKCCQALIRQDAYGYAIGGLSGGQQKESFWKVVQCCTAALPKDKPVYLMGVGYPEDMLTCVALGVDMFDCVFPTRTARFGTALTRKGPIKLKNHCYQCDFSKLDQSCNCDTCRIYTKAFLHSIVDKEEVFCSLITTHNLNFLFEVMRQCREAIINQNLDKFLKEFMEGYFQGKVPQWIKNALESAQMNIDW